ncbi:MAG TPA: hypothetical protein VGM44_19650 [Polyangiaceae bacterium]|jgi:hypothetical protein
MRRACAVLLISVPVYALLQTGSARADVSDRAPESPVPLSVPLALEHCEDLDGNELRKLLAIEFETLNIGAARPNERVLIRCDASGARVSLEPAQTEAEVDFTSTAPAARPRLLALTVSELVVDARAHAVKAESAAAKARPAEPVPKKAAAPARESDGVTSPVRVSAGGALRYLARPGAALWGPQIGLEFAISRYFSFGAAGGLELGQTSTSLARVRWLSERASLFTLFGGSAAGFDLSAGAAMCLGRLSLSPSRLGAGEIGHEVDGIWAGPELIARARHDLGGVLFALASVEGGVTTLPVKATASDGRQLVDTSGSFLSIMLGIGAAL